MYIARGTIKTTQNSRQIPLVANMKVVAIILVISTLLPLTVAYADGQNDLICTDEEAIGESRQVANGIIIDHLVDGDLRGGSKPTTLWAWSSGVYYSSFSYHTYTYSGKYYKLNSSNQIYYHIKGSFGMISADCSVITICKTCSDTEVAVYPFKPEPNKEFSAHRVVTLPAHSSHNIYFKLTNAAKVLYFTGNFNVSNAYI